MKSPRASAGGALISPRYRTERKSRLDFTSIFMSERADRGLIEDGDTRAPR
jgi:hypothetical protein